MLTVRKHVDIAAPVDAVFSYLAEPSHQVDVIPSLTRSTLVEYLPNGGALVSYTYRIGVFSFSGTARATDYVPNERIVWTIEGDLTGTLRWYFASLQHENGTRFTYAATYTLAGPSLLRPLVNPLVRRYNEREVRTLLQHLKFHFEAENFRSSVQKR